MTEAKVDFTDSYTSQWKLIPQILKGRYYYPMNLRNTIKLVHRLFERESIEHVLIGGLGLSCYGSTRATMDVDLLIHEESKERAKNSLLDLGLRVFNESPEVIQFDGVGNIDLLIARRPISQEMLFNARQGGPEGIQFARAEDLIGLKIQAYKNDPDRELQDKADIQFLIRNVDNLDYDLIKKYADMFGEWKVIHELKK